MEYSVIILLLPLCMFLFLGLVGHKLSERVAGILGTIGLSVAAVLAYMHGEKGFQRYYAFLSLFSFSMLGLVVATNIFQMYIFWELVGVSSYLLIGFYYTKPAAVSASKKAFIVTRFADLGFLIGILILSFFTEPFDFCYIDVQPFGIGERNGRHDLYGLFGSRLGYGSYLYGRCR